jgi:hypothetical protein
MEKFEDDHLFGIIFIFFPKGKSTNSYGTAFIIKQTLTHYILLTAAHNLVIIDSDFPDKPISATKVKFRLLYYPS